MLFVLSIPKPIKAQTRQQKSNFSVRCSVFKLLSFLESTFSTEAVEDFDNLCLSFGIEPLFTK